MKKMRLHNPTDKDIVNYKIEEAKTDHENSVIYDKKGVYERTGRTLEWTIMAGETLDFPEYVGKYLTKIYEFLVEKPLEEVEEEKKEEAKPTEGAISCKYCGKHVKNMRGLGLHISMIHPEELQK